MQLLGGQSPPTPICRGLTGSIVVSTHLYARYRDPWLSTTTASTCAKQNKPFSSIFCYRKKIVCHNSTPIATNTNTILSLTLRTVSKVYLSSPEVASTDGCKSSTNPRRGNSRDTVLDRGIFVVCRLGAFLVVHQSLFCLDNVDAPLQPQPLRSRVLF